MLYSMDGRGRQDDMQEQQIPMALEHRNVDQGKSRRVRTGRLVKVVVAYGTLSIDQGLLRLDALNTAGTPAIVVGIVRNPNADCWWLCVARSGSAVHWVSAHRRRRDAEAQVPQVQKAVEQGALRDDVIFAQLLEDLAAQSDNDLQYTLPTLPQTGVDSEARPQITYRFRSMVKAEPGARARMAKALKRIARAADSVDGDR